MSLYKSYLDLVKACNRVVDNDTPTKHRKPVSSGRAVAERELTKFALRNKKKEAQIFGYLTPGAVDTLPWDRSGVMRLMGDAAPEKGDALTYGFQADGNVPWLNAQLTRMALKSPAVRQNFPFVSAWGNGSGLPGDYLPVIGAPDVKMPECLAPIFGIVHRKVNIVAYTQTPNDVLIWVHSRPASALHYPSKLDNVSSGFVLHGETRSDTIDRLVLDEMDGGRGLNYKLTWHKPVAYFTIRGADAGELEGLAEAGIEACRSFKASEEWVPRAVEENDDVGEFALYTVEEVKDSLLDGEWKPGSALAMLRFLIDKGLITEEEEPELEEICQMMLRRLPHYMPKGTFP